MICRTNDLKRKDVINVQTGTKIGCVDDVEIDTVSCRVLSLVIYGPARFFGLFGRDDDFIIPWSDIDLIGEDAIIVHSDCSHFCDRKRSFFFFK